MMSPILGLRIREIRKDNSLTLESLGEIVDVKKNTLSQIENGKGHASLELVYKIANHFNVSIDYLLGRTDNPEVNK